MFLIIFPKVKAVKQYLLRNDSGEEVSNINKEEWYKEKKNQSNKMIDNENNNERN